MSDLRRVMDDTIQQVRTLTAQVSPVALYELGLSAALSRLAEQLQADYGTLIDFNPLRNAEQLSEPMAVTLFQVARELLLNALKHARATRINLHLSLVDRQVRLSVCDDGIGFDPETVLNPQNRLRGFGLFNVMQKVEHLNGNIEFLAEETSGMNMQVSVPLSWPGA